MTGPVDPQFAELERKLAEESERADRVLRLLNRQTEGRMRLQKAVDRYAIDIPEYRHALGHVVECEDNCEQCRRLAGDTLDRTAEHGTTDYLNPIVFLHPPWQVQLERNDDGSLDIGLVLAGRANRLSRHEATTLSVALKIAVDEAMSSASTHEPAAGPDWTPDWTVDRAEVIPVFDPDWVVKPGEMLKEWAEEHRLTPREAATRAGIGIVAYLDLEAGEMPLTPDVAEVLEEGTGIKAQVWLSMENRYREGLAAGKTDSSTVEGDEGAGGREPAGPQEG